MIAYQALVKYTVGCWLSASVDIVHVSIGNLYDGLVDNILVRLDTELDLLELLWQSIHDLVLDGHGRAGDRCSSHLISMLWLDVLGKVRNS